MDIRNIFKKEKPTIKYYQKMDKFILIIGSIAFVTYSLLWGIDIYNDKFYSVFFYCIAATTLIMALSMFNVKNEIDKLRTVV